MSVSNAAIGAGDGVVYQLNPVTPPLNPAEVDSGEAALEIVILWGEQSILHVAHVSPPRAFYVGDAMDAATDFLIGSESLGTERLPVVVEHGSGVAIVIPVGAFGDVTVDEQVFSFAELPLMAAGPGASGAALFPLPLGAAARVSYRGFTFIVKQTSAARRIGAEEPGSAKQHAWTLASMVLHASLLIAFQLLPPRSSSLSLELLNADSRLVSFQNETERVEEQTPSWLSGERHEGDEGQMGEATHEKTQKMFAVRGERRNEAPQLARIESKLIAASAGIIGILKASASAAPTSMFGRDSAVGDNSIDAVGAIVGDQIGANFGFGGLGLRGHGRGGGGNGDGAVGIGEMGTLGHRRGGSGSGYGKGAGGLPTHTARVPQIRSAAADVHGSLSKEVIRRVIGRHVSEVRHCYQQALHARPDLQGRVAVKFIIAPTGAVQAAAVDSSELGNVTAEQCIAQAIRRWAFPAPEGGGIVVVNYPFMLSQSGD